MDNERFDRLARHIAGVSSRRALMRSLAGAIFGGLLLDRDPVAAATCRPPGSTCREHANCCSGYCGPRDATGRHRCACPTGATDCNGRCLTPADLARDPANCGACGYTCPAGVACTGGVCVCPDGRQACRRLDGSSACCAGGETCEPEVGGGFRCCPTGTGSCARGGLCVDFQNDASHCGDCATNCGDLFPVGICQSGVCRPPLTAGEGPCISVADCPTGMGLVCRDDGGSCGVRCCQPTIGGPCGQTLHFTSDGNHVCNCCPGAGISCGYQETGPYTSGSPLVCGGLVGSCQTGTDCVSGRCGLASGGSIHDTTCCHGFGQTCSGGADGICCAPASCGRGSGPNVCGGPGADCGTGTDCVSGTCTGGVCA